AVDIPKVEAGDAVLEHVLGARHLSVLDKVTPASVAARAVDIPKVEAGDAVLEHVTPALDARQLEILNGIAPVKGLLGKVSPVTDLVGEVAAPVTGIISARACQPCMAGSIVSDTLSKVQPLLEKIESLKVTDIAIETLEPLLHQVTVILAGATVKVNALVGTIEHTVDEVSIEALAKELAPLINTVVGTLDGVLELTKEADIQCQCVTKLLSGVVAPLGDLTHSITSLVGKELTTTILPLINGALGPLVSQLGCVANFSFLGNIEQLAVKVVGGVTGLL
ncbi:hypothetical protein MPER_05900, partial [Moniliophthora perniciosa FA553]